MKLCTKSRYAVVALVDLAQHDASHTVSLPTIAARQNLPLGYLEQLFRKLRKAGIVMSSRGYGSGYKLANPPAEISLLDIFLALDINVISAGDDLSLKNTDAWASTQYFWHELRDETRAKLKSTSLADLGLIG